MLSDAARPRPVSAVAAAPSTATPLDTIYPPVPSCSADSNDAQRREIIMLRRQNLLLRHQVSQLRRHGALQVQPSRAVAASRVQALLQQCRARRAVRRAARRMEMAASRLQAFIRKRRDCMSLKSYFVVVRYARAGYTTDSPPLDSSLRLRVGDCRRALRLLPEATLDMLLDCTEWSSGSRGRYRFHVESLDTAGQSSKLR